MGRIGDIGQSIFSFQGADVQQFIDFSMNNMKLYKIEGNHRSTEQIINILNHVRGEVDFSERSPCNKNGALPKVLIGGIFNAYNEAVEFTKGKTVYSLSYRNDMSNTMKFGTDDYFDSESINEPIFKDSDRGWMISFAITSIEYCRQGKINDAIKFMRKAY